MSYTYLSWDSEFFGFPIARIDIGTDDAQALQTEVLRADADRIECLYCLCPAIRNDVLRAAVDLGFRPYDVRLELELTIGTDASAPPPAREATLADGPSLERIARESLVGTRFWNDDRFSRERVKDLYAAWVQRAFSTPATRRTLIGGDSEGFVVCAVDTARSLGTIELIAVAEAARASGLASDLMVSAHRLFARAGLSRAVVVTQVANIAAQRLYQRLGYQTSGADFWLHRWRT